MKKKILVVAIATSLALLGACSSEGGKEDGKDGGTAAKEIALWTHNAGNDAELKVLEEAVTDFNKENTDTTIEIQAFPQVSYNDSISAAAASKELPCILDLDGPIMPNWAWAGYLAPLDFPEDMLEKMLPSTVGKWNDQLYSVGPYETSLTILARKSVLESAGIRIPDVDSPWTKQEFEDALAQIKLSSAFQYSIDMSVWDTAEWWPYAYAPMLQSFGGDLIDRKDYQSAEGVLNGPEAVAFGEWFNSLFEKEYASRTPTEGGSDFLQGKVPLAYSGGWKVLEAMEEFGADEVLMLPPVDLGKGGPKVGGASWQYGVSSNCTNPEVANDFIKFLMQDKYLIKFSDAIGTFPTTESATKETQNYGPGKPLEPLVEISKRYAMLRPATPGYAVISSVFDKAMHDIMAGEDVKKALDQAVTDIDNNIKANDGYQDK